MAESKKEAVKAVEVSAESQAAARQGLVDGLENEIVRHERSFDAITDGVAISVPAYTPQDLHNMRLKALRLSAGDNVAEMALHLASMQAVQFGPAPQPKADGTT